MDHQKQTAEELQKFQTKWQGIFSSFGAILVLILIDFVAFHPSGAHKLAILSFGFLSILVCLYAGKKLRDVERVDATIAAQELMSVESYDGD